MVDTIFPTAFAIILAVTYGLPVKCSTMEIVKFIVISITWNVLVLQFSVTYNHVKVSCVCQTDFLLLEIKPNFCKLFWTKFEFCNGSASEFATLKPSCCLN